jgi:PBSX family phage portal protein
MATALDTTNKKVLKNIRAKVINLRKTASTEATGVKTKDGKSKKANDDPLCTLGEAGKIIEAPFEVLALALILEQNTELGPCVEAMEVNIDSFGHRFVPRTKIERPEIKISEELKLEIKKERVRLENFFEHCTDESFVGFRRKLRKDYETTGNYCFEVVRGLTGEIQSFVHIPSYQVRMSKKDEELFKVERPVYQLQLDGTVKIIKLIEFKRFRTYVQSRLSRRQNLDIVSGNKVRWFKEFGDTRIYDVDTGNLQKEDETIPIEKQANEMVYVSLYSARSPYGLPRYIGNLLSIYGNRAAEEINYITFKNNNVPSLALLCSNGQFTQGTIERIQEFIEKIQDGDNYSKILILEAEGEEEGEDGNQVKIDLKPLTNDQHKDALFQNYSKNNKDNIRRAFRLPPIFLGQSDDYNKATATTSRILADEQVFAPERNEFDELMNRKIFPYLGIVHHKYKSNSPNTTDNEQLVKMLATSEKTGGMTPFIARFMLEEILGRDLPEFPTGFDPNVPFSLLMAEAVKNKADPAEPGQQVTALKSDGSIDSDILISLLKRVWKGSDPLIEHLTEIQSNVEKMWSKNLEEDHEHDEDE